MVRRIGHIALRVADLDAAVDFQREVIGMVETERIGGVSYLTCNERHHELILIQDAEHRGYDHVALEVADVLALELATSQVANAGGELLGGIYDGEPGIDRALRLRSPDGQVFKLFCGMETGQTLGHGDRPIKFEHVSFKTRRTPRFERFLRDGLGFRFSDRMGPFASWWHCAADHHGIAVQLAPKNELSHYAYAWPDLNALGRVAARLKAVRNRKPIWGPSRHGPGHNHFLYIHDQDGAMVENCSELAQMAPAGSYQPRNWRILPDPINQWGGHPPLRLVLTGSPIAGTEPSIR
jgi:catechol 2,3-dioxygenase-like lactoylglutathione lyase family enzyme